MTPDLLEEVRRSVPRSLITLRAQGSGPNKGEMKVPPEILDRLRKQADPHRHAPGESVLIYVDGPAREGVAKLARRLLPKHGARAVSDALGISYERARSLAEEDGIPRSRRRYDPDGEDPSAGLVLMLRRYKLGFLTKRLGVTEDRVVAIRDTKNPSVAEANRIVALLSELLGVTPETVLRRARGASAAWVESVKIANGTDGDA